MKHFLSVFMTVCLLLITGLPMTAYAAEGSGDISVSSFTEENAERLEKYTQQETEICTEVSMEVPDVMTETIQETEIMQETGEIEGTRETEIVEESQTVQETGATQETETEMMQETGTVQETGTMEETQTTQETETETADSSETESGEITAFGGCLRITKTDADNQEAKLSGAVFSVYKMENGQKAGELMTGDDGTANLDLSAGSYTLRETLAPDGYVLSPECISFSIQEGSVTELAVANRRLRQTETKAEPGALRITKRDSENGQRLKGAVIGIYHTDTNNHLETLTTDRRGVAETELEPGNYYYLELEAPDGYVLEEEKTSFSIESGKTKEITVKNRRKEESGMESETKNSATTAVPAVSIPAVSTVPDSVTENAGNRNPVDEDFVHENYLNETGMTQNVSDTETAAKSGRLTSDNKNSNKNGILWIHNAGAGTGEKLSGAVFAVYGNENKKIGELTVNKGKASLSLSQGSYYLKAVKAAPGYGVEAVRIHFTVVAGGTTLIEITSETDLENTNPQKLIPKTGETPPVKIYAFSLSCYLTAILCGLVLWKDGHKGEKHGTIISQRWWRISVWGSIIKSVRLVAEK